MTEHADSAPRKGTILIVDDDEVSCEILREPLERIAGYRVEDFSCAEDAIGRAKDNGLEALIIDIRLQGMSGITLIRKLRSMGVGTPCLLVSSQVTEDDERIARTIPWCRVVEKPIDGQDIVEAVESLIERHQVNGTLYGIHQTLLMVREEIADIRKDIGPKGARWLNVMKFMTMAGYRGLVTAFLLGLGWLLQEHPELVALVEGALKAVQHQ